MTSTRARKRALAFIRLRRSADSVTAARLAICVPALARDNFTALPYAHATRLRFDGLRCSGVEYWRGGETKLARARREVIVCGGAINSPQLLLLSGLGPAGHLADVGIRPRLDLPGVGLGLTDHMQAPLAYHCQEPVSLVGKEAPQQQRLYEKDRMGMLTSNLGEAGGFVRLDAASPRARIAIPLWSRLVCAPRL